MSRRAEKQPAMVLKPVALVKNDAREPGMRDWSRVFSELVFEREFVNALDGLEDFSHIIVIFWMHLFAGQERIPLKTHPQMRTELPLVGIFATRSPIRPNPLGIAVAQMLERKGNVLRVKGLDAVDGTPVVDVKPYFPGAPDDHVKVPDWVNKLQRHTLKMSI